MTTAQFKTLKFTPTRVLSTWAMTGGAAIPNTAIVFTLIGDDTGNKGVVVRHHAYTAKPKMYMDEFCVWDGSRASRGDVTVYSNSVLPLETAREVWNRFMACTPSASYNKWKAVSPDPYTVSPDEFLSSFGEAQ